MRHSNENQKVAAEVSAGGGNCDCALAVRALLTGVEKFGAYKTVQRPLLDAAGSPPRTLQRRRATRAHEG